MTVNVLCGLHCKKLTMKFVSVSTLFMYTLKLPKKNKGKWTLSLPSSIMVKYKQTARKKKNIEEKLQPINGTLKHRYISNGARYRLI